MNSGDLTKVSKIKIYIGCSLTHAPEEFRQVIEDLKKDLRPKYHVFDFLGLGNGTPLEIYESDIQSSLANCDLFVAICDHASLGLGYEIGTAVEAYKKPVLALAHKDAHVSDLIQGVNSSLFHFKRYTNLSEIEDLIKSKLATLSP